MIIYIENGIFVRNPILLFVLIARKPCPSKSKSPDKFRNWKMHYDDVIIGAIASLINSLKIVYSNVYSDADQRKHQS